MVCGSPGSAFDIGTAPIQGLVRSSPASKANEPQPDATFERVCGRNKHGLACCCRKAGSASDVGAALPRRHSVTEQGVQTDGICQDARLSKVTGGSESQGRHSSLQGGVQEQNGDPFEADVRSEAIGWTRNLLASSSISRSIAVHSHRPIRCIEGRLTWSSLVSRS